MGVLLLLRHGQASLGTADYDRLSGLGRHQADAAGERLAHADPEIDRIVCGTLTRQRDTALAVLERLGRGPGDLAVDERLDEYDHVRVLAAHSTATTFEGATTPEANRQIQSVLEDAIDRWADAEDGYPERHDDFGSRVLDVVSELAAQPGTTLAVTSGGVIALACTHLLGLPTRRWGAIARVVVNGSITKILSGRSGTNLLTFNDHAHLESVRSLITYR